MVKQYAHTSKKSASAVTSVAGAAGFGTGRLDRIQTQAGNRRTMTFSAWIKRSSLGVHSFLFGTDNGVHTGGTDGAAILFGANDQFSSFDDVTGASQAYYRSDLPGPARDTTAWYHIMLVIDTAQSVQENRVKLYINGVHRTGYTSVINGYSLNAISTWNQAKLITIGDEMSRLRYPFNGLMTEFHFLDGTAANPYDFGKYDQYKNWVPIDFKEAYNKVWQTNALTGTTTNASHMFVSGGNTFRISVRSNGGANSQLPAELSKWEASANGGIGGFVARQTFVLNGAADVAMFTDPADSKQYAFIAQNNTNALDYTINSGLYEFDASTDLFLTTPKQTIATTGGYNSTFWYDGSEVFMFVGNRGGPADTYNQTSRSYKWNGSAFIQIQTFATNGCYGSEVRDMANGGQKVMMYTNQYNGTTGTLNSPIMIWNTGTEQWAVSHNLLNTGARWPTMFDHGGVTWMVLGTGSTGGKLYKWDGTANMVYQSDIPGTSGQNTQEYTVFVHGGETYAVAGEFSSATNNGYLFWFNGTSFELASAVPFNGSRNSSIVISGSMYVSSCEYLQPEKVYKLLGTKGRARLVGDQVSTYANTHSTFFPGENSQGVATLDSGTKRFVVSSSVANKIELFEVNLTTFALTSVQAVHNVASNVVQRIRKHVIGGDTYVAVAIQTGPSYDANSKLYKWNTGTNQLDFVQNFATHGAKDVAFTTNNEGTFITFFNHFTSAGNTPVTNISIWEWNGSTQFNTTPIQTIATNGNLGGTIATVNGIDRLFIGQHAVNSTYWTWTPGTKQFATPVNIGTRNYTFLKFTEAGIEYVLTGPHSAGGTANQLFKWTGSAFVLVPEFVYDIGQNTITWTTYVVGGKRFFIPGHTTNDTPLFRWDGTKPVLEHIITGNAGGAQSASYVSGGKTYVVEADNPSSLREHHVINTDHGRLGGKNLASYGPNGFHLLPTFPAKGTIDPLNLGKDFSGNGNDFTTVGTLASVDDGPAVNADQLNPLNVNNGFHSAAISGNNRVMTSSSAASTYTATTLQIPKTGKWFFAAEKTASTGNDTGASLEVLPTKLTGGAIDPGRVGVYSNGATTDIYVNGVAVQTGLAAMPVGTIVSAAMDMNVGSLQFYFNGVALGTAISLTITNPSTFRVSDGSSSGGVTWTIKEDQTPPSGFKYLKKSEVPIVLDPKDYTNTQLITVSGAGQYIECGHLVEYVEIKRTDANGDWYVSDIVRGAGKHSLLNTTAAEVSDAQVVVSFDPTGFTIGTTLPAGTYWVHTRRRLAGWFDIVTHNGTGVTKTEAHALGVTPDVIITKGRDFVSTFTMYAGAMGNTGSLFLSSNGVFSVGLTHYNNTDPTTANFTLGSYDNVNRNGNLFVSYLLANHPDLFQSGTYTSNYVLDGPFIPLPFKAAQIVVKTTDQNGNWVVKSFGDVAPNNPSLHSLIYNNGNFIGPSDGFDGVANGVKIRATGYSINRPIGNKYLYMAFADTTGVANAR